MSPAASSENRVRYLTIAIAAYVLLSLLLVVPLLVVISRWEAYAGTALGLYLTGSVGGLVGLGYMARRWGFLELSGPGAEGLGAFFCALAVLTGALIAIIFVSPRPVVLAVASTLYAAAIGYAIYRLVNRQSQNLAFSCGHCGVVFDAGFRTWLLSPNLGSRKGVSCPECGRFSWARIVHKVAEER